MAIYGNLREPRPGGGGVSDGGKELVIVTDKWVLLKRTKQMGFRLGEIFTPKVPLNLAHLLTFYAFSPSGARNREGESPVILSCDEKEYKTSLSSLRSDLNANGPLNSLSKVL